MRRWVVDVIPETPVGAVAAVWSAGGLAAVEIGAATPQEAVFRVARRLGNPELDLGRNPAGSQLREYFAGRRRAFRLKMDFPGLAPFHAKALAACMKVPYGRVVTYGEIARASGSPGGSRAVGQALKNNPVPIVIPCHRVVGAAGLGGFSAPGGARTKRALLKFEGVDLFEEFASLTARRGRL